MIPTDTNALILRIQVTYRELQQARAKKNYLRVELLENALNDLLEKMPNCNANNR